MLWELPVGVELFGDHVCTSGESSFALVKISSVHVSLVLDLQVIS